MIEFAENKKNSDIDYIKLNNPDKSISNVLSNVEFHKPLTRYKKSFPQFLYSLFCQCFRKVDTVNKKIIYLNCNKEENPTNFPNIIKNQKYNLLTLIPLVLINQFSMFCNQFYLSMAISQFFDQLKVGFLFTYVAPLVLVLSITIFKEAIDDFYRYKRDQELNNQKYTKISSKGRITTTSSKIKIGDLIELKKNDRVPADLVILKSYDHNQVFIRTDQLDGETDWKLRKPIPSIQKLSNEEILELNTYLHIDPPSRSIYEFTGVFCINEEDGIIKEPLGLENTIWMNTVLASENILGVVIYTGKETRSQMNSSLPRIKLGLLDLEINKLNKILFIIMLICSFIIMTLKGISSNLELNLITYFRFLVLLCSIIPISLRTNLDISKSINSSKINSSDIIPETIARNSMIPEELGRIEFLLSDKTGTLTKNEMIFKKLSLEADTFNEENLIDLKMILEDECRQYDTPMPDLMNMINKNDYDSNKRIRRNRTKIIRDTITAITVCNNVTPIIKGEIIDYQCSSPDEIALVKYAESLNMRLIERNENEIKLINANNVEEKYEILANFPFSSDTKRMGIILKNKKYNQIVFYLKGAENVIENFVKEDYKSHIRENSEILATSGLRTLVICQKILDQEFYFKWIDMYQSAQISMNNRKEKIEEVISQLEVNMDFLCVTGVEDQLQDEVPDTIEILKNAGIKIWMLTGDKIETAKCIAISTGLKKKQQRINILKDSRDIIYIRQELEKLRFHPDNILIIDGTCLEIALSNCEKIFFETALELSSIICCRCSPTQKAKIVRNIRKFTNKRTAAIGDGGNDVAMIQEANVGIGIVGKEGKQASLAADYSITKFKHLNLLLLWFGRLSYKNTATISKFIIHRGLIISFIQFIFSILFYCSSVPIYSGILILGYTSAYTSLPVISLLYDKDTEIRNVMKFPNLYKSLQKGRELSIKAFLWWFWKSLFQASVIMLSAIFFFEHSYLKIATITFTSLIIAELLNVYTEIKKFHKMMIVSLIISMIIYGLSLLFLKSVLDVYYLDLLVISKILAVTFISWIPFYSTTIIKRCIYPEIHEKLNSIKN